MASRDDDPGATFHAHLDQCDQCRNHPFKLCHAGAALLRDTAEQAAAGAAAQHEQALELPPLDEEGFPF